MRGIWLAAILVAACGFDSSGAGGTGSGADTDSGTGGTAGTDGTATTDKTTSSTATGTSTAGTSDSTSASTTGVTASAGTTTDGTGGTSTTDASTTGPGSTSSGGSTGGSTTMGATTGDPCEGFTFTEVYPAEDGTTVLPMDKYGDPNNSPGIWAQSQTAEEGTITWDVDLACPAKVYLWAVVWDLDAGANGSGDADSFYVAVDGETPEWRWVYGCTTTDDGWSYQPVTYNDVNQGCMEMGLSWDLTAGAHTVRLRNREASTFQGAAGVARLLVTTDPNLVPDIQNY